MAGAAGLNWQGIPQAKGGVGIRAAMETAAGGDFSQLEITIAAAAFPDAAIQEDLDTGIDQHSMTATLMHPEVLARKMGYEEFLALVKRKDAWAVNVRKAVKPVNFGIFYFCQAAKVAETLGVTLEEGEKALARYYTRYSGFAGYRRQIERETQTADTERWGRESVSRMADSVVDMTGYQMRWQFEKSVAAALWELGGEGIRTGRGGSIIRTPEKGSQTIDGAVKSALLGGAIAIQAAVSRQRGNAKIQATGANLCKMLAARLWEELKSPMVLIHDEIQMAPHANYDHERAKQIVDSFIAEWKPVIPSLAMDFCASRVWADK
jgi:DNA polymerase I-like protein with 3'-5' exonuclease and polymerase domains